MTNTMIENQKASSEENNKMDTIRDCIQKQEKYQDYIEKIDARVATLKEAKKKLLAALDANQNVLTGTLLDSHIRCTVIDHKKLRVGFWTKVEVSDKSKLPEDCFRERTVKSVDKVKIRKILKENPNAHIDGAALVTYAKTCINPDLHPQGR